MTSARHKQQGEPSARPRRLRLELTATAATVLTTSVVGVAIASNGQEKPVPVTEAAAPRPMTVHLDGGESPYRADRVAEFSRSAKRVTLKEKPAVKDHKFMTSALNLWPAPKEKDKPLQVLEKGGKVAVTGVKKAGFAQILFAGQVRWVNADYLADKMPKPKKAPATSEAGSGSSTTGSSTSAAPSAGTSSAPCPDGSGTESGLTPSAVKLFRAVCNAFPALSTYGGYDGHGEHSSGRAIDFMVSDASLGQAVADWARAHSSELNLFDVIWSQHIWTPVRSSEGWRSMPDRGSPTANHFDHVHISVN